VVNIVTDKVFNLTPIRGLKRYKVADVERLEEIGRIRRYIERNNIVYRIVFVKFEGVVAFIAVDYK
jgi:hypothetical protein